MRQSISLTFFSVVLIWLFVIPAAAGIAGSLDPTFGNGGKVLHNLSNSGSGASAVAGQTDGKLVFAGSTGNRFSMTRLNADGTLDASFGTNGVTRIANIFETDNISSYATDLIIQSDGRIVAVGSAERGNFIPQNGPTYSYSAVAVVRYNQDGSLDTSFDNDGIATTLVESTSAGYGIELQADGKIVVADFHKFAVIRYNTNGSPDTTFGINGIAKTDFGSGYSRAQDLKIQPDGKIVIAGYDNPVGQILVAVARYNTNGTLDTTFDGDGKLTASIDSQRGYGLEIQPDGKIIVLLTSGLVRLLPNGGFDTAFGSGGVVNNPANFIGREITLQTDGKILAAGTANWVFSPPNSDFGIARFLSNGSPDTTFDGDGMAVIDMSPEEEANAVAIQPDGKIVAGGFSKPSAIPTHLAAVRVQAQAHTFADFDGDAKTDVSIFRPSNGQWWLSRSSDSGTFALEFGISTDKVVPADYTGDGKTDIAVFRPASGEWFILRSENYGFYGFRFGSPGDIPQAADFDGDGKADYGVFRPSTNSWFVLKSSGGLITQRFGSSGDVPTVGDYDGDGKADIAIYRPASGEWWISKSGGGILSLQFGGSSDKPVQGDYTGDGKTDIAVWRASTGEWFVLRSENTGFYSSIFGTQEDMPVPGDYDGDGKTDIAVYRPSNRIWYVNRSMSGILFQQFGTGGDKPVPAAFIP